MSGGRREIIVSYSLDVVRQNEDMEHWDVNQLRGGDSSSEALLGESGAKTQWWKACPAPPEVSPWDHRDLEQART